MKYDCYDISDNYEIIYEQAKHNIQYNASWCTQRIDIDELKFENNFYIQNNNTIRNLACTPIAYRYDLSIDIIQVCGLSTILKIYENKVYIINIEKNELYVKIYDVITKECIFINSISIGDYTRFDMWSEVLFSLYKKVDENEIIDIYYVTI
jgi:hypothetical protein